eukprot:TRINITY_DN2999_c0_g1_i6.p1 TRINITY_DN2999_c0_g1~~TRINITY_DN2999_c0_g1_i6.p1  ORF type:complete len:120 (+),score=10.32 TRINITY_DN2999_c0_g1_i6:70-429(+)
MQIFRDSDPNVLRLRWVPYRHELPKLLLYPLPLLSATIFILSLYSVWLPFSFVILAFSAWCFLSSSLMLSDLIIYHEWALDKLVEHVQHFVKRPSWYYNRQYQFVHERPVLTCTQLCFS